MNLDACAVRRIRGPRDSRLRPDGLAPLPWPDAKRGRGRPRRPAVCCPVWRHRQCNRPHPRSRRCLRSVGDFCIDRQASGNRSSDVASKFPRGVQGRVRLQQPSVRRQGQRHRSRRTGLRFRCSIGEIAVGGRPTIKMIATAGERISVGVEVPDNHNALTDVRWLHLTAQIGYAPFEAWSASENISSTRTAVGQYSAYYTVPPNISRDAIVSFQASAVNPGGGVGVGSPVYVEFPDPFLIWYRTAAIGASNVTVEFDVASNGGQPLPNVTVSV